MIASGTTTKREGSSSPTPDSPRPTPSDLVIYELSVKSFFDGNGDGVGDFRGLTQKLDYLQQLGVNCLWLLPFYPSPWKDDGYDVSDYRAIHPALGTIEDFQEFLEASHRRGIGVLAELVLNHTSDQHPWFQAARSAPPGSPLRDFYHWSDSDRKYDAARVLYPDVSRSNWAWDATARAYYFHRFHVHQPELNCANPLVRDEIRKIVRFWLDLGVDGLYLNAVAFLAEREGTDCEHLPETHAILKELRREVDARYPGRLLLAGVSAWPSEARNYFGEGDECQLTTHMPLALRLFMALRQEDRHPITDLMRQTPMPPAGCQWATLLRNHDELTLVPATEEERDYMYREYAADPRMRGHLGIRRRLAPLVDNNRRRLELLFGLLFSLPGTPIVYYGDEIGMGDNIYLAGRTGVRTPMQWSGDRNAGFSTADFARLDSPPVADPVFGYPAVNVDAQQRDPSSLLHWLRRLIAQRKHSKALARGTLELVGSSNRKVLAFIRRHEDETVLVVANLSRFAQPVQLDLAAFQGLALVELAGQTEFPRVGDAPYFLTLGPRAFSWFRLHKNPQEVAVQFLPAETEELDEVPELRLSGGWDGVLDGDARRALEADVLPKYLPTQRWFGGKARRVRATELVDWAALRETSAWLLLARVEFADGAKDLYFLPLAVTAGPDGAALLRKQRPHVVARLKGPHGDAVLHNALTDEDLCRSLLAAVGEQGEWRTRGGVIRAVATAALDAIRGTADRPLPAQVGPATSSNSLVFFGRRLLLKVFRRLEVGTNPDFEVGRFLTESDGIARTPKMAGALEYHPDGGGMRMLAVVQQLVPNQGDGWRHAIDELGRYFDRAATRMLGPDQPEPDGRSLLELASCDPPPGAVEVIGGYLHTAGLLGRRTAEMHLALAHDAQDPDFAPEPLTAGDMAGLIEEVEHQARQALDTLRTNEDRLPASLRDEAQRLLDVTPPFLQQLHDEQPPPPDAAKIRVHGDYHLGQVLWADGDFYLIDFEGEPTRTVEDRRAKQSPLKDVAGMLRSLDYAAYAGLFASTRDRPDDFDRLEPWADLWQRWTSAAFLRHYREAAGDAAFLPRGPGELATLLRLFMLGKAFYELVYELNNRPDWVRIPLRGLLTLLEQEQAGRNGDAPALSV